MNTPIIKRYERDQARRLQAAELFEQDLSNAEIGRRLHVSRQTVSGWYQTWKDQGEAGLKVQLPGPSCRLSQDQKEQILEALVQGPEANGYETPLWTLARITQLIAKLTGISYHPGHVWYLMEDLDWTCQKPEPIARERNQAKIDHFVEEEFPHVKKGLSSEGPSSPSSMRVDSPSNPAFDAPGHRVVRRRSWSIASTGND
jgi:transposase